LVQVAEAPLLQDGFKDLETLALGENIDEMHEVYRSEARALRLCLKLVIGGVTASINHILLGLYLSG
jgi:hypothetical protein